MVEDMDDSSPPFYTSLNIHDKVMHNCLMDLGASHNLMPKIVMEELGLEELICTLLIQGGCNVLESSKIWWSLYFSCQ